MINHSSTSMHSHNLILALLEIWLTFTLVNPVNSEISSTDMLKRLRLITSCSWELSWAMQASIWSAASDSSMLLTWSPSTGKGGTSSLFPTDWTIFTLAPQFSSFLPRTGNYKRITFSHINYWHHICFSKNAKRNVFSFPKGMGDNYYL